MDDPHPFNHLHSLPFRWISRFSYVAGTPGFPQLAKSSVELSPGWPRCISGGLSYSLPKNNHVQCISNEIITCIYIYIYIFI